MSGPDGARPGWMDEELRTVVAERSPLARLGTPADAAALVTFLRSERGGWVNGQLIHSDGGIHS